MKSCIGQGPGDTMLTGVDYANDVTYGTDLKFSHADSHPRYCE